VQLSAQTVKPELQLYPGLQYATVVSNDINFEHECMEIKYSTHMQTQTQLDAMVNQETDSLKYDVNASYGRIDFSMATMLLNLDMSSASGNLDDPMNRVLNSLTGKVFNMDLEKNGSGISIGNLDSIITVSVANSVLNEEEKLELRSNMVESFGSKALKDEFSQNSAYYNEFPVSEGDSWVRSITISTYGIPMNLITVVIIKDITRNTIKFQAEGTLAARNNEAGPEGILYDLSGTQVSEVSMDRKTGLILESHTSQYIHGKVITSDENDKNLNLEFPIKINSRFSSMTSIR